MRAAQPATSPSRRTAAPSQQARRSLRLSHIQRHWRLWAVLRQHPAVDQPAHLQYHGTTTHTCPACALQYLQRPGDINTTLPGAVVASQTRPCSSSPSLSVLPAAEPVGPSRLTVLRRWCRRPGRRRALQRARKRRSRLWSGLVWPGLVWCFGVASTNTSPHILISLACMY